VFSHFGAPVEVLTDQGTKFQGEFQVLCDKALIDHRTTSRDHPEADGLIERVVQMVKKTLRKYGLQKGHLGDWDIQSPWLAMGYRFSRQASLALFSPYFLLYDQDLDLPTTIRRESNEVVNLDDLNMWLRVCSQHAELFRRVMPTSFENLAIVQHKDTLQYATIRGGGYRPSIRRFHVGDYVYLQHTTSTTLDVTACRTILRV
jgi:transposase InsO family protein